MFIIRNEIKFMHNIYNFIILFTVNEIQNNVKTLIKSSNLFEKIFFIR